MHSYLKQQRRLLTHRPKPTPIQQRQLSLDQYKAKTISISHRYQQQQPPKKTSLPPIKEIQQQPKVSSFSLEHKKTQILQRLLSVKHPSLGSLRYKHNRSKTQPSSKSKANVSSRASSTFQQIRMKPVDKYFHKLDNIRLAERLLIVKPSPEVSRSSQRKFYQEQQHYKGHISRNYNALKSKKNKFSKMDKKWVD